MCAVCIEAHLTVLACKSIGAPDKTAAGVVSVGSLPFITRFGTGEYVDVPWSTVAL